MAFVFTTLDYGTVSDDASAPYTITTADVTPAADALLILTIFQTEAATGANISTIVGCTVDWQEEHPNRLVGGTYSYGRRATATALRVVHDIRGMGAAPTQGTIVITFDGPIADVDYILTQVQGVEPGGTAGDLAVAQIEHLNTAANGTSGSVFGGRFVDQSNNAGFLSAMNGNSQVSTVESGYTQLVNSLAGGACNIMTAYDVAFADNDVTYTWSPSASWSASLWELVPAGGFRGGGLRCQPLHHGNNNANPLITDSTYPPDGITIFEVAWYRSATVATNPVLTPTGGLAGLTWVKAGEVALSSTRRFGVWYAIGAPASAGTLSLEFGANQNSMAWRMETITGVTGVRNLKVSPDNPGTSTSIDIALDPYASIDSGVYACFALDDSTNGTFHEGLESGLPCTHQPGGYTYQRSEGSSELSLTSGWCHSNFYNGADARRPGIDWTSHGALHGGVIAFELGDFGSSAHPLFF